MPRLHYASTKDADMLYILQHRIADPFLFLETDKGRFVFLSKTDIDAFNEVQIPDIQAVDIGPIRDRALKRVDLQDFAVPRTVLEEYGVQGPITVPRSFPLDMADGLRSAGYELVVAGSFNERRVCKNEQEVAAIAENTQYTCEAFQLVESILKDARIEGDTLHYKEELLTSEYVKQVVETFFLTNNMDCPEGLIVSCGPHAAMPHHSGTGPLRPHQTIVVDLFPQSRGNHYFADMTRTYVKGTASDKVLAMYQAVRDAQALAQQAIKPGVTCEELYTVSADSIRKSGFDVGEKGYTHSLGHGLGVAVHESPALGRGSKDVLSVGQVITLEPGLYYEEYGGVRIEDTVVVTEEGCTNLTNYPKELCIP